MRSAFSDSAAVRARKTNATVYAEKLEEGPSDLPPEGRGVRFNWKYDRYTIPCNGDPRAYTGNSTVVIPWQGDNPAIPGILVRHRGEAFGYRHDVYGFVLLDGVLPRVPESKVHTHGCCRMV